MTIPHPAEVGVEEVGVVVGVVVVGRLYKMKKWERSHYKETQENVYQKTPTALCTSSYF
jgi:hypothetical protein